MGAVVSLGRQLYSPEEGVSSLVSLGRQLYLRFVLTARLEAHADHGEDEEDDGQDDERQVAAPVERVVDEVFEEQRHEVTPQTQQRRVVVASLRASGSTWWSTSKDMA